MKTVMKNVLLGSVAGLAMVGTAAAADLPVKAKAAEYVKICSTYGAGFYYIPGTDTCLKVGGYVTADLYVQDFDYNVSITNNGTTYGGDTGFGDTETYFLTRGAIQLDARTQTEYGTLRSYFEGRFEYGNSYGVGNLDDGQGGYFDGGAGSLGDVYLQYAYIQFAGFTFGKATSAFDFWAGDGWQGIAPGNFYSDTTPNLISYTADFGNGFSATISLEDGYAREGDATFGVGPWANSEFYYAEPQSVPDIVANIAYEGSWGAAKLSGALHDLRGANDFFGPGYSYSTDDWGWAVLAGVKFEFAETTTLYIEGAYADGAAGYLGLANFVPNVGADGSSVDGWYVGGSLIHYWTPSVFTTLVGSYTQTGSWYTDDIGVYPWDEDGDLDFEAFNVGVNVGWQPVKGLTFVLQYDYLQYEYTFSDDYPLSGDSADLKYEQNRITFSAKRAF